MSSRVSKKVIKAIQTTSVFDSVLRERFTSSMTGYFADERPEMWQSEQREIFDIAAEVEYRTLQEVLRILGVESTSEVSPWVNQHR